ncbi:MAG: hypothetical protein ACLP70_11260 [Streptosporangiaceae bacterium]|jgi:hypothetical protein
MNRSRLMPLLAAGVLATAVAAFPAGAASAASTDSVQFVGTPSYNLFNSRLAVAVADPDVTAVLTITVTATGQKLGILDNYHSATDPTDVQARTFEGVADPAEITVTSNLGSTASSSVVTIYRPSY